MEDLKIFGVPYQQGFMAAAYSMQIPQGLDLLVSHEPPHKILDFASASSLRADHIGSRELKSALGRLSHKSRQTKRRLSPRVHLFGHVHEGRGAWEQDGTLFLNVANANPGMARTLQHPCVVLDLATDGSGEAQLVSGLKVAPRDGEQNTAEQTTHGWRSLERIAMVDFILDGHSQVIF